MLPVREHRKKLCWLWDRVNAHNGLVSSLDTASGSGEQQLQSRRGTQSYLPHLALLSGARLTTSRKLFLQAVQEGWRAIPPFLFRKFFERGKWRWQQKKTKKEYIRKQIIAASRVYQNDLAGKVFLYVFGENYFEVVFQTDRFMHLTGVNSGLTARDFYKKAKKSQLTTEQFYFDQRHPYTGARKKLTCLPLLPALTNRLVCVVKELRTVTLVYKLGVTNLDFTIGLTENLDPLGNKLNDWFLPRTLRVKDKAIERSAHAEFIDFIFSKNATESCYHQMTFREENKTPPDAIKKFLSPELITQLYGPQQK